MNRQNNGRRENSFGNRRGTAEEHGTLVKEYKEAEKWQFCSATMIDIRSSVIYTTMIDANLKPQYIYAAIRQIAGSKEMPNERHRDMNRKAKQMQPILDALLTVPCYPPCPVDPNPSSYFMLRTFHLELIAQQTPNLSSAFPASIYPPAIP